MDSFESYDSFDSDFQREEKREKDFRAFEQEALLALEVFRIEELAHEDTTPPSQLFVQLWPCRCCEPIGQSCLCSEPIAWESDPKKVDKITFLSKLKSRFARLIKRKNAT